MLEITKKSEPRSLMGCLKVTALTNDIFARINGTSILFNNYMGKSSAFWWFSRSVINQSEYIGVLGFWVIKV